jgi:hypothetical protein
MSEHNALLLLKGSTIRTYSKPSWQTQYRINKLIPSTMTKEMYRMYRFTMLKAVQGAEGGINLNIEQTKLHEFWGHKEKDFIAPNEFIKRIDNMAAANAWSDHITFRNFALALRGSANTWLESLVTLEDITGGHRV